MCPAHQLLTIFCEIDDFCNELDQYTQHYLLTHASKNPTKRGPLCCLATSEIMTILIYFQHAQFRHFKAFYTFLTHCWHPFFPRLPSYNRFIELIKHALFPLALFTQLKSGKRTGIYYIDSTCLPCCQLTRSRRHKTFDQLAQYGKTSVGWFFGLKLHLVINDKGERIAFKLTQGHRADNKLAPSLLSQLRGLAFADKGYMGQTLFDQLLQEGLKLITRKRKNMKPGKLSAYVVVKFFRTNQ
jgi:hypothetical protein